MLDYIKNNYTCLLASIAGSLIAILADTMQKNVASAVFKIKDTLVLLGIPATNWLACIVLIAVGTLLCGIFNILEKKRAFYSGLGVISFIMTVVPYEKPKDLKQGALESSKGIDIRSLFFTSAYAQTNKIEVASVQVDVKLVLPEGKMIQDNCIVTLKDVESNVLGQSIITDPSLTFYQKPGTYLLQIEASGYELISYQFTIEQTDAKIIKQLTFKLQQSAVPVYIQKIFKY